MRKTCISLHPFQLRDEVIYSVKCYNYGNPGVHHVFWFGF